MLCILYPCASCWFGEIKILKHITIKLTLFLGGCGAMYQILIESPDFAGKRAVQQHRMVNEVNITTI